MSQNYFGISEFLTGNWIKEGYADYISKDPSTPFHIGLCQVERSEDSDDRSDIYFKYFLKMKYALEVDRRKYKDIASLFSNYKEASESTIRQFAGQLRNSADIICAPQEKSL